ncbi:wall-associated receptor kinase 2-like [Coffea arabica]|uniref:Wall-associated receptor kinase 2-like n=1 Tax=Coffea arabica TaxID=13443 RepID=A0A6P6UV49_COFAR
MFKKLIISQFWYKFHQWCCKRLCGAQLILVVILAILFSRIVVASAAAFPIAKPGCNSSCGNVEIPYPFGMTEGCYLDEPFQIICNTSFNPPKPISQFSEIDVTRISLEGQIHVLQFVARKCFSQSSVVPSKHMVTTFSLAKFTLNHTLNKFTAVGCDTYGFIKGFHGVQGYTTGCMSICYSTEEVVDGICSGGGCCQTSIPKGTSEFSLSVGSFRNHSVVENFNPCSSVFVVEQGGFNFSMDLLRDIENVNKLPVALDWTIGNETCEIAQKNLDTYACQKNSKCINDPEPDSYPGYRCSCLEGYEGNPYIACQDIDECQDENLNTCTFKSLCKNEIGGNKCSCPNGYQGDGKISPCLPKRKNQQLLVTRIIAGIALVTAALLAFGSWLYFEFKRRKLIIEKQKFFQENGGLLLQQELIKQKDCTNIAKIFTAKELEKATNNFDEKRVIGQGSYGTVYKGNLTDCTVVAIKKSRVVDRSQIDHFINEVIVLSQINHRNVVKLLGCCLEMEVPLLVYEFINNGTLFDHMQDKAKASVLCWDTRLRIATETAGALSYLHSAASPPIIHRDIKSVNILLDDKYTAKVSDFGTSRLVPMIESEIPTMVQGTIGYLDPEYLQTSQLTEKSDVYSFGVVLVELLTGKKVLCFERSARERTLASYFLSSIKDNRLFEVLDDNIDTERNAEQLKEVAMLAKRCLNVKGEDRPTMKEVALELEGMSLSARHSWVQHPATVLEEMGSLLSDVTIILSPKTHVLLPINDGR